MVLESCVGGPPPRYRQQGPDVHEILGAATIITGQHLQREQVPGLRDRDRDVWKYLDKLGRFDDLGLDARRGEQ
ncbi:hypothetical protein BE11_28010 [Sorangium cellulosum]|nr:hypothetical protein BE11_28010 [Sorangium cellulosum]